MVGFSVTISDSISYIPNYSDDFSLPDEGSIEIGDDEDDFQDAMQDFGNQSVSSDVPFFETM